MLRVLLSIVLVLLTSTRSRAHEAQQTSTAERTVRGYGLVIGSNVGGAGQQALQYAEQDSARVAAALSELARFDPQRITRLGRPTRAQLIAALDALERQLQADAAAGRETMVVFYYSGHARAQALNLGQELFDLGDLRARILSLPSQLKLVILDACQSGAFSRAKGAEPAADFSYNSVEQLRTAGIAVMASSSESELSQESERLQASYFTHHMLTALRGGGDANHDGQVTLAETYQYAYHRTLASTSETAIGGQHVTLETELRGQGDVALSYPARANASLTMPATLSGEVIVTQLPSRSVVAEVHKVAGQALVLALPAGHYAAIVRESTATRRCDLSVMAGAATVLDAQTCPVIIEPLTSAKGGAQGPRRELWALRLGVGLAGHTDDNFNKTLDEFGYGESDNNAGRVLLSWTYAINPYLSVGGLFANFDSRRYSRDSQDVTQGFEWHAYGIGPAARIQPAWAKIVPYAEASAGVSFAQSTFDQVIVTDPDFQPTPGSDDLPPVRIKQRNQLHAGAYLSLAAGVQLKPWERVGLFGQLSWTFAPTIGNQLGDAHDVGGLALIVGVTISALEAR